MPLKINVAYANVNPAQSFVWKDANFKNINVTMPKFLEFTQSDVVVVTVIEKGQSIQKRAVRTDGGLQVRGIIDDKGIRYQVISYTLGGVSDIAYADLESVLSKKGITLAEHIEGTWKIEFKPIIPNTQNSHYDVQAIKNSLTNLFTFAVGERIILPDYGSVLPRLVGATITDGQVIAMKEAIEQMLGMERRIEIVSIDITPYPDDYQISIIVRYTIPTISLEEQQISYLVDVSDG